MNILVVDDEKFNLKMAQDLIEANIHDSKVFLCNLPEEVIQKLDEHDIGIVLLDIVMPNVTGIDVLKSIRSQEKYNDIQIIMFTGMTDKESFKTCFENGANDYINKPINFTEFIARMKASVRARKNILALKEMNATITTQYKKLQAVTQQLKDTQFNLIQKEKLAALGEIAAGIAHEINNPMGFISSNLDTMSRYFEKINTLIFAYKNFMQLASIETINHEKLFQRKAEIAELERKQKIDFIMDDLTTLIQESSDGANRVTKIVQSLRNLAKTGTENEMAYNDLSQLAEEALLIVKHETEFVATIDKQMESPLYLLCNKGQIGQVMLNILLNAIYAVKSRNTNALGKISIKTYSAEENVICEISDDGPGIQEEHLSRIFDPFFTTKDVGSGVGLGLSVAYDIVVKKHGGELDVTSELDKGTSFIIKLPTNGGKAYHAEQ
ncbi:MAG: His kinase (phospho-acceptor) domain/response regulator receiver domain/histidine kinase [Firmicutes bacterium]|nr:His kinase (phospho-acceptor) domain/response regulator receiver domain/histidine kinase [Bacillota bacterium]